MRVNVYAEELTNRVEYMEKEVDGQTFYGIRFYLELPVTKESGSGLQVHKGPFMHKPGDDDSAAVTFWAKSRTELSDLFTRAANEVVGI